MKELIEQLKQELLKRIKTAYEDMYSYDYKDSMHSLYHGEVMAYQDFLGYLTMLTTKVKEESEVK